MDNSIETMNITSEEEKDLLNSDDDKKSTKINLIVSKPIERSKKTKSRKAKSQTATTKPNSKSSKQAQSTNDEAKHNQLLELLSDIKKQNEGTNSQMVSMKKEFDSKFVAIDDELESNKKSLNAISNKLKVMENKVDAATYDKELGKQQQIKNNISIFGFPKVDGEDIVNVAICVFKAFGCKFDVSDFSGVYRTNGKSAEIQGI